MFDEPEINNIFQTIHDRWVEPELSKRRDIGSLPEEFIIKRCLIKFPKNESPIVEFNEEIVWDAKVKFVKDSKVTQGESVYLNHVDYVESVKAPSHAGERVAFVFLFSNGSSWQIVFDFSPNVESSEIQEELAWDYGEAIASYLNQSFRELSIQNDDDLRDVIDKISLWPAPALLPNPFTKICEICNEGKYIDARSLLVEHCDSSFLTDLVESWSGVTPFKTRAGLFIDSLGAHMDRRYSLSVSALVPHIEGVITDWIYINNPVEGDNPWKQESRVIKFRELIETGSNRTFSDQRIADSVINFILHGPVLSTFKEWTLPVIDTFPNRNVIGHGKYVPELYSEENSVKLFLMLDTLYQIMLTFEND